MTIATGAFERPLFRQTPPETRNYQSAAYVGFVILLGAAGAVALFPKTYPDPALFFFLVIAACVTSAWKVNLPIALSSGSTLSVSYAANLMALVLLGPRYAVLIAAFGVWTQCTVNVKQRYPIHRTVFSIAAQIVTMTATGLVYESLGGSSGPFDVEFLMKPLVGAIATYFVVNTGLVAGAIALTTSRTVWNVWREEFLWSAASFMVAGSAGAMAAVVIDRGQQWKAVLLFAPVYLTYRTYHLFVARLEDQKQHRAEAEQLLEEMKRLEESRAQLLAREREARASAEAANGLKDQFLATVSHELRTPLNAILGWSDMLCSGILPEARRGAACAAIFNNAKRQARLVEELLDMARIMSGKLRLDRTLVDPLELVTGALETVQPSAEAKGIAIAVDIDVADPVTFYGDGQRLQQILWNLLSNSVKFTPDGGKVKVRIARRGRTGEIVVADTGTGIPRDFLPAVFEPFRQADGSSTRLYDGLGLGLAIVKQLVDAHGGSIKAESGGPGRGATFTVRLPIARDADCYRLPTGDSILTGAAATGS